MSIELEPEEYADEIPALPLNEFLECFSSPQRGKIVEGLKDEFDANEAFDIPPGASLNFHRKVSPNVPVSFQDGWGASATTSRVKVTIPVEFPGKFYLLPFDPVSEDCSPDHIYHTVEDLVRAFPLSVQANASYGDRLLDPTSSLKVGDRLKLLRLIVTDGIKYLQCRLFNEPRLLLLPMVCQGDFTVLNDETSYMLADLISLVPRKRRAELVPDAAAKIPGLPSNYTGDLFIEVPESFVEASPVNDPGLIIGLPLDLDIMIQPDESVFDRGQLLSSFAHNNRNLFPVAVRVTDWDEETSILEHHFIKPGVEIVLHGWTRQSKVLCRSGNNYFAVPLTYQGKFKLKPKQYVGVTELLNAYPGNKLRVIHTDVDEPGFPLVQGDVIRIRREDSIKKHFREVELKCEKFDANGRTSTLKLPLGSAAVFEELVDDGSVDGYAVRELVSFVSDQEIVVELTTVSADQKDPEQDLPRGVPLTMCDFIVEPAVYVSVDTVESPAFHIPLRTLIYLTFLVQYEKNASPLLTKNNPRLSTLDRCVEAITADVFGSLRPKRPLETEVFGEAVATAVPETTSSWARAESRNQWPETHEFARSNDRPPSVTGSDMLLVKSRGLGSRIKNKFRRHKSTENLYRSSSKQDSAKSDFSEFSLPRQKDIEYTAASTGPTENVLFADGGHVTKVVKNGHIIAGHNLLEAEAKRPPVTESSSSSLEESTTYPSVSSSSPSVSPTSPLSHPTGMNPMAGWVRHSQGGLAGHKVIQNGDSHSNMPDFAKSTQSDTQDSGSAPSVGSLGLPHIPPGFALVPVPQTEVPPGYMLVPMYQPQMSPGGPNPQAVRLSSAGEEEDYDDGASDVTFSRSRQFKLAIPQDGNLYHFSTKKMTEFLRQLRVEEANIKRCIKEKLDGKKFSRLTEGDLDNLGILHPIVVHFRKLTRKQKQPQFML